MKSIARYALPAAAALAVATIAGPASGASAAPGDPCETAVCSFHFDVNHPGQPLQWTVPEGVYKLTLGVAAGSGADHTYSPDDRTAKGGAGGHVTGSVAVAPGNTLALAVGERGGALDPHFGGHSAGTYQDGGNSGLAGGGGAGTYVFLEQSTGSWIPLLIAGGGGGASATLITAPGGNGGFSGNGADADEGIPDMQAPGGSDSGPGYVGGPTASYDGTIFIPGRGEHGNSQGGGGGGYAGGAGGTAETPPTSVSFQPGGGGGAGFADPAVTVISEAPNYGDGFIDIAYDNPRTDAELSVDPGSSVVGETLTLGGSINQLSSGGTGTLIFAASLDGDEVFTESVPVTTAGPGPFLAHAAVTFDPPQAGNYEFTLEYVDAGVAQRHLDATAASVNVTVIAAASQADTLADTGAPEFGPATLTFGAGLLLLGGSAILVSMTRRKAQFDA